MHAARLLALLPLLWMLPGLSFAEDEFLPPKEAFKPTVAVVDGALTVSYEVAPGYYLYRDRLGFESGTPGVTVGPPPRSRFRLNPGRLGSILVTAALGAGAVPAGTRTRVVQVSGG